MCKIINKLPSVMCHLKQPFTVTQKLTFLIMETLKQNWQKVEGQPGKLTASILTKDAEMLPSIRGKGHLSLSFDTLTGWILCGWLSWLSGLATPEGCGNTSSGASAGFSSAHFPQGLPNGKKKREKQPWASFSRHKKEMRHGAQEK